MPDEIERRLTVLEVEHKHMVDSVDQMSRKVDEMHTLLTKARGGWWFLLCAFTACGFIAGKIGSFLPLLGGK
jgi:hypothetical protein